MEITPRRNASLAIQLVLPATLLRLANPAKASMELATSSTAPPVLQAVLQASTDRSPTSLAYPVPTDALPARGH